MVHAVEDLVKSKRWQLRLIQGLNKTYDTHALPGSNECCNTNHEANGRNNSPAPTSVTESDESSTYDTTEDAGNTKATGEDDAGPVTVANGPSDKVGVGLVTQRPFDCVDDHSEGCRMSRVGQGVK